MNNKTFLLHIIMTVILTLLIIVQIISICVYIDASRTVEPTFNNMTDNVTSIEPFGVRAMVVDNK